MKLRDDFGELTDAERGAYSKLRKCRFPADSAVRSTWLTVDQRIAVSKNRKRSEFGNIIMDHRIILDYLARFKILFSLFNGTMRSIHDALTLITMEAVFLLKTKSSYWRFLLFLRQ